jgi:NAD(P)-dependent dehydrogenase (short-subunit alcohol dehydrogenase family)
MALLDISPTVQQVAGELRERSGVTVHCSIVDAADYGMMSRAAEEVLASLGRCDHVVVPAGIGSGQFGFPFWNLTPSDWDRVLRVNIMAPVHAAHVSAPTMVQHRPDAERRWRPGDAQLSDRSAGRRARPVFGGTMPEHRRLARGLRTSRSPAHRRRRRSWKATDNGTVAAVS